VEYSELTFMCSEPLMSIITRNRGAGASQPLLHPGRLVGSPQPAVRHVITAFRDHGQWVAS
jgi:hypothetical protein